MGHNVCDGDCFNCKFDDCINNLVEPTEQEKTTKELLKARKKQEQRERKKAYMREYNAKHKKERDEYMAVWRLNHPDYMKEYWQRYKTKKVVANG